VCQATLPPPLGDARTDGGPGSCADREMVPCSGERSMKKRGEDPEDVGATCVSQRFHFG
jgi:hypothetical protein